MKLLLLSSLLLTTSCGKWYADWQGEIHKIEMNKKGEAMLLEAQSSRHVAVLEAQAKLESAKYLAEAEVERAKGVAQANAIIGDSLKNNDAYIRYLYISNLEKAESNPSVNTIYVATEAGIPVMEAGRR